MPFVSALNSELLYTKCDPQKFSFNVSTELEDLSEIIGQTRALDSLHFGIGIKKEGFNLFVLGPHGMGKHTMALRYLEQQASSAPTPDDWCYVNNFIQPHKPIAITLPAGMGHSFCKDMDQLLEELLNAIPLAFETEEYRAKVKEIEGSFEQERENAIVALDKEAKEKDIELLRSPSGFVLAPVKDGKPLLPKEFDKLPASEKEAIGKTISALEEKLNKLMQHVTESMREARKKIKELNREVAIFAAGHLVDMLKKEYIQLVKVVQYLESVQQDVVDHVEDFRNPQVKKNILGMQYEETLDFRRYQVNLLVDNSELKGAPVIYDDNPMYQSLVGRVEHLSQVGTLVTDFTLIKPGSLHLANGGYLILDARKLLLQPYSWEGLKRALASKEIRIQSLAELFSLLSTISLQAEPIPLDIKIVLLGDRLLYYLLLEYDPEFAELFKVAADFEESLERNDENDMLYARMIATLERKEGLLPFDKSAVARIIEYSSRKANDTEKLTTHMLSIVDLMRETDYWTRENKNEIINSIHVQQAIDAQIKRADRLRDRMQEDIQNKIILIDTQDEVIGQINGLAVISLGDFSFAQPTRITATTRLGDGKLVDISRESKLGGSIHSKGVFTLGSFFSSRFGSERPMSFSATLSFEQTYGKVEGDSASVAELCVLLSSLAEVPIKQSLAVTGSVNQFGQVQAIGGVNEKIEGFFDTCKARELTGQQGVIIPASNVRHLMLNRAVVEAAEKGLFHIYAVNTIDEAISLLTGIEAGEKNESGTYPEGSINQRIDARLDSLEELCKKFSKGSEEEK